MLKPHILITAIFYLDIFYVVLFLSGHNSILIQRQRFRLNTTAFLFLKLSKENVLHISQAILQTPKKGSFSRVCACLDCVTHT